MRRKIISEHASTEAMAERSTMFATTSTSAAVTRMPRAGRAGSDGPRAAELPGSAQHRRQPTGRIERRVHR